LIEEDPRFICVEPEPRFQGPVCPILLLQTVVDESFCYQFQFYCEKFQILVLL
jgi:hypothetical protein